MRFVDSSGRCMTCGKYAQSSGGCECRDTCLPMVGGSHFRKTFAMHYKNGRKAKVGDRVVVLDTWKPLTGILIETDSKSTGDSCDCRVITDEAAISNAPCARLADCLHVDDLMATPVNVVPDMSKES